MPHLLSHQSTLSALTFSMNQKNTARQIDRFAARKIADDI